jgi:hypothetical protein
MDKFDAPWMLTGLVNMIQALSAAAQAGFDRDAGAAWKTLDLNLYQSKYAPVDSPSNRYLAKRMRLLG